MSKKHLKAIQDIDEFSKWLSSEDFEGCEPKKKQMLKSLKLSADSLQKHVVVKVAAEQSTDTKCPSCEAILSSYTEDGAYKVDKNMTHCKNRFCNQRISVL